MPEWTEEEQGIIDDSGIEEEVFTIAEELDIPVEDVEEAYNGQWNSDEEFVEELLDSCGDLPELPFYIHIDWESTARDVMMDYSEHDGHYFRNF